MYLFSYEQVSTDTAASARERELEAMRRSLDLLRQAEAEGAGSTAWVRAFHYNVRLWSVLAEDLVQDDNGLPDQLRGDLISIYVWLLGEAERIRLGQSDNIAGLIDVTAIIAEGLEPSA